jgi:predicted TIM-barrel fold metal-dependent hydrolase
MVVVDADSHVWEPGAIWTDYLSAGERVLAQDAFFHDEGPHGTELTVVNGQRVRNLNAGPLNRFAAWRPGMGVDDVAELDPATAEPVAGARDPAARLADLDALGVDQQLVFPTLFTEHLPVVDSPVAAEALARAYNDWIADFCSADPQRLHPVGVLPLQSIPATLRELERLADKGFRAVLLRPCAHQARYLHFAEFAPMWAQLQETGVVACVHPSAGTTNPEFTSHGPFLERVARNLSIGHDVAPAVAPVQDNMLAILGLLYYGHLEDFPGVRLSFHHAGASWLELVLEKAETYLWLFPGPIPVSLEPDELWFERATLVTFDAWEDTVAELHDVYGPAVAWGSRYPHHDASSPDEARATLARAGVPEATVAAMLGGNAVDRFRLPVAASQHAP